MELELNIKYNNKGKGYIAKNKEGKIVFLPNNFTLPEGCSLGYYVVMFNKNDLIKKDKFDILKCCELKLTEEQKMLAKHGNYIYYDWLTNVKTNIEIFNHVEKYKNSKKDLEFLINNISEDYLLVLFAYKADNRLKKILSNYIIFNLSEAIIPFINEKEIREKIDINYFCHNIEKYYLTNIGITENNIFTTIIDNYKNIIKFTSKEFLIKCLKPALKEVETYSQNFYETRDYIKEIYKINDELKLGLEKYLEFIKEKIDEQERIYHSQKCSSDEDEFQLTAFGKWR